MDITFAIVVFLIFRLLFIGLIGLGIIKLVMKLVQKYESLDQDEREKVHHYGKRIFQATVDHLKTSEKHKTKTESFERFMKTIWKD